MQRSTTRLYEVRSTSGLFTCLMCCQWEVAPKKQAPDHSTERASVNQGATKWLPSSRECSRWSRTALFAVESITPLGWKWHSSLCWLQSQCWQKWVTSRLLLFAFSSSKSFRSFSSSFLKTKSLLLLRLLIKQCIWLMLTVSLLPDNPECRETF